MSTQDKAMKERSDTLQKYVSDMIAVEEHIAAAVKRQTDDEQVYKHNPQASQIIQNIAQSTEMHAEHLKHHLEAIGGDPAKGVKELATAALGAVAGMYDKMRNETVSKMLRDDYTALNLAAIGYTMLHTTGLALQDQATADIALRHLKHYTSIVMQINQVIPSVVVEDLRNTVPIMNEASTQQAMHNTQDAWRPSADGGSYQGMSGSQGMSSSQGISGSQGLSGSSSRT
jgi:ferritin-like metal-binding protein YciE